MVKTIQKALPRDKVLFANDSKHVPYGNKSPKELLGYVVPIMKDLESRGCQTIVVACNTVSTTLIKELRAVIGVPLIAIEPMIKPAAMQTKTKIIAVCATPTTLGSNRYAWLKRHYASGIKVIEPDCSDWSHMIETKKIDHDKIISVAKNVCDEGADIIVLGCTHYHWIEDLIKHAVQGKAKVLQPEEPVISQLERVLQRPA